MILYSSSSAVEMKYEIYSKWRMLVCAGFGYSLELDNANSTFRLEYGSECETVVKPVFTGKFKVDKESLILDFGDIKAHYYLKSPYEPACDNISDSLTEAEQRIVCDPTQFADVKTYLAPNMKDKVFIKEATLFLSKIEGMPNDDRAKQLVTDLKSHCFIALKQE